MYSTIIGVFASIGGAIIIIVVLGCVLVEVINLWISGVARDGFNKQNIRGDSSDRVHYMEFRLKKLEEQLKAIPKKRKK